MCRKKLIAVFPAKAEIHLWHSDSIRIDPRHRGEDKFISNRCSKINYDFFVITHVFALLFQSVRGKELRC